jgi:hypothetical protein
MIRKRKKVMDKIIQIEVSLFKREIERDFKELYLK